MQHQRAISHILKEKKVKEEIVTAFRLFRQSRDTTPAAASQEQQPFEWHSPVHRCTERCQQFFHGAVCVCVRSANWHYCTKETCDQMIKMREHMVCPLSGTTYDLDLEWGEFGDGSAAAAAADDDQQHYTLGDYEETEDTKAHPLPKHETADAGIFIASDMLDVSFTEHRLQDMEEQHEKALQNAQKELDQASHKGNAEETAEDDDEMQAPTARERALQATQKRVDNLIKPDGDAEETTKHDSSSSKGKFDDVHNRRASFQLMLTALFKERPSNPQLFDSIVFNAEKLWLMVHSSGLIKKESFRYQTNYHLLAILNCMCTGYKCANKTVVPMNDWIRTHCPLNREIHKLSGISPPIKVKNFTQTTKLFRRCVADVAFRLKKDVQWTA